MLFERKNSYETIFFYIKMLFFTAVLLGLLFVQVSCQDNVDVINAFRQACPYTNFCQQNASQTIKGDSQVAPCCRDCSCADDCWKRDNCCPDKIVKEKRETTELESCKDTYVKKSIYNVYTPNGFGVRKRYFVIESCPGTEIGGILEQKCARAVAVTFNDLIWVSDTKTNKIYNNRFCAECNGVRKYKKWGLSTTCRSDLLWIQNFSENVGSFPDSCSLVVIPPNRKAYENQCLTPDISTCNETGLWQTKDSVIESLCKNHQMMFVKEHLSMVHIYRNVFCSLCNSSPWAPEEDICGNEAKGQKSGHSSFTAILNIFEADDNLETKNKCNVDEVEDPLRRTCFKLLCPETQFPRYGSCQKVYSDVYFLGITITYRLRPNLNKLKYGTKDAEEYSITGLGQAIRRQMYNDLGLGHCGSCRSLFYKANTEDTIGNIRLPSVLDFSPLFYTYGRKCSDIMIVDAMSKIIKKELIVYMDEEEYVTFDIEEIEHSTETQENMSDVELPHLKDDDGFCGSRIIKKYPDLNRCPTVKLDPTYNQSLMSLAYTEAQKSLVSSLFAVDGGSDGQSTLDNTTSVCWEDYKKLVSRLTSSSRRSSGNLLVTVTTVLVSIILY